MNSPRLYSASLSRLAAITVISLLLAACGSISKNTPTTTEESSSSAGGRPIVTRQTEADQRAVAYVWQKNSQFIRIEEAEPGAPLHSHPVNLTATQLTAALNSVQTGDGETEPLFTEVAVQRLASPLAKALSEAKPNQEVTFALTLKPRGKKFIMSRQVTTGRIFFEDDGLHLIVGLLWTPYEDRMRATGYRIPFTPGSRASRVQEGWTLATTGSQVSHPVPNRDDWVRIDSDTWSAAPTAAPAFKATPSTRANDIPITETAIYQRLEMLKKLREKGVISEEAYEERSRQILEEI